jgi:hypothetical protein
MMPVKQAGREVKSGKSKAEQPEISISDGSLMQK